MGTNLLIVVESYALVGRVVQEIHSSHPRTGEGYRSGFMAVAVAPPVHHSPDAIKLRARGNAAPPVRSLFSPDCPDLDTRKSRHGWEEFPLTSLSSVARQEVLLALILQPPGNGCAKNPVAKRLATWPPGLW